MSRITVLTETEMVPFFAVNPGDKVSFNGIDFLTVWTVADNLTNGTRTGLRFVERDEAGRRYYRAEKNATTIRRVK